MPRVAQYQAIRFEGFPDGLNLHADEQNLEVTELAQAKNCTIGDRGRLSMVQGIKRWTVSSGTPGPRKLFGWNNPTDSSEYLVWSSAGPGGTGSLVWATIPDGVVQGTYNLGMSSFMAYENVGSSFAPADDVLFYSHQNLSSPLSFDGSTWTAVAGIPSARVLVHHHNRLFAISTNDNQSRIYFSNLLDPTVFDVDDWIDVDPFDGERIVTAVKYGDDLMIFKETSVWKLSGRTPSSFSLYRIDSKRGIQSPECVVEARGRLFLWDTTSGIWAFDGASFELVSDRINPFLVEQASQDRDVQVQFGLIARDDQVWCLGEFWNEDFTTLERVSFAYFLDTNAWSEMTQGFREGFYYLGQMYLGYLNFGDVFIPDRTTNEILNNEQVMSFETPWISQLGTGANVRVRRVELSLRAEQGKPFTISMFRDFIPTAEQTRIVTIDAEEVGASTGDTVVLRVTLDGWGGRCKAFQFAVSTQQFPFEVLEFDVLYTGEVDLRGEQGHV